MNCFSYPKAQLHEVQDTFQAFATQEDEAYTCPDFLSKTHQKELISNASTNPYLIHTPLYQGDQDVSGPSYYSLTPGRRETIVEWKYRVVDSFDIDRKIVAQSTNNLDRYTSRCPVTAWTYQLATVTSLYIVAKLHKLHKQLSLAYFVKISGGKFTANNLQDMELKMLEALGWRLNPPVPILHSTYLLVFALSTTVPKRPLIMELTRFLTEAILTDYYFVSFKCSTISIAAVLTAIDISSGESAMSMCHRTAQHFGREVSNLTKLDAFSSNVFKCMGRMKKMFLKGGFNLDQFDCDAIVSPPSPVSTISSA
mmetsp:Transcript_12069/g.18121  ORF Transcript_12069/g.18121 Transcript_12069/m.18121 type:complete len:311 (+) Transcript_12069:282-1214(+)